MIVRLFTSVAAHLVKNLTERPSEMHPSVKDWGAIALTLKHENEFHEWRGVANAIEDLGLIVIPSLRLEPASEAPWFDAANWDANLDTAHRMMDAIGAQWFAPDVEAYKAKSQRSPSDIAGSSDRILVRGHCDRFARRLGARKVYVGPSSADCLLTRAFAEAGVKTIGVIQGSVQRFGAAALFGDQPDPILDWYHERALRLHQAIPGARAMPQLYASALRAHAAPLPATIPEPWVYVGSASQFSRASEREIGTKAWFAYETESPLNVGCSWFAAGHHGNDVLPRGKSYTAIVRGGGNISADRPNLRSWSIREGTQESSWTPPDGMKPEHAAIIRAALARKVTDVFVGDARVGTWFTPRHLIEAFAVVSGPGTAFVAAMKDGTTQTITYQAALDQAGHIMAIDKASIETWRYPLAIAEIEAAIRNPYPRLK